MRQIYNFERVQPPVLNESMLRGEMERRTLRLQTLLLTISAILLMVAMLLLGIFAYESYPLIALLCFAYTVISATGGGIMAVIFTGKGGLNI